MRGELTAHQTLGPEIDCIEATRGAACDNACRMCTSVTVEPLPGPISQPDLPAAFPSPFDEIGPHPLAQRAAEHLQQTLPVDDHLEGKVFGVLVVRRPTGALGYLKAFSGKWGDQWLVPGFAPPLFDVEVRARLDQASDAALQPLQARLEALAIDSAFARQRESLRSLEAKHQLEVEELKVRHDLNRLERARQRASSGANPALDQLSRVDTTEKRRLTQLHTQRIEALERPLEAHEQLIAEGQRALSIASATLVKEIIELPKVPSGRGESRPIASFFDKEPPGGVGECAAPKLLAQAYRHGLTPIALAEFWWGPTQATGRVRGAHVPACKVKCGPILPFMLEGLVVTEARRVISRLAKDRPLTILYEDQHLRVIDKPEGLLSVSGRERTHLDAVETRMPDVWVAHRLDLDTSGVLLLALDLETHVAVQQQFSRRQVTKRYIAIVEKLISDPSGTIELPLRPDVEDRPRQIHDPVHGKEALTRWVVTSRDEQLARSRLSLEPLTGRTHQLRVHCANPLGLDAPIVGDRLYGRPAERLMLHCELLELTHPVSGARLRFVAKTPF